MKRGLNIVLFLMGIGLIFFVSSINAVDKGKLDGKGPVKSVTPAAPTKAAPVPIGMELKPEGKGLVLKLTRPARVEVYLRGKKVHTCDIGPVCKIPDEVAKIGDDLTFVCSDASNYTEKKTMSVRQFAHLFKPVKKEPEVPSKTPPLVPGAPLTAPPAVPTHKEPPAPVLPGKVLPPTAPSARPDLSEASFMNIERLFLKGDTVRVVLKKSGKGELGSKDSDLPLLLQVGDSKPESFKLAQDVRARLNSGEDVEFDTGIKMTERSMVHAFFPPGHAAKSLRKTAQLTPMAALKPKTPETKKEPELPSPPSGPKAKEPKKESIAPPGMKLQGPDIKPSESIPKGPSLSIVKPSKLKPRAKGPGEDSGITVSEPEQGSYQTRRFPIHVAWHAHGDGCTTDSPFTMTLMREGSDLNWPCGTALGTASEGTCEFPDTTPNGTDYYVRVRQSDTCRGDSWDFQIGPIRDLGGDDSLPPGTAALDVREPSGSPTWYQGSSHSIRWQVYPTHFPARVGWEVNIRRDGAPLTGDAYNMYFNDTYRPNFNIASRTYSIPWTVPEGAETGCGYTVRVLTMDNPYEGGPALVAESNFCIEEPVPPTGISVWTPEREGATLYITQPVTINWRSSGDVGNVRIRLMRDGGEFETLAENQPATGAFLWPVGTRNPALASSEPCSDTSLIDALGGGSARGFRIRIEDMAHPEIFGEGPGFKYFHADDYGNPASCRQHERRMRRNIQIEWEELTCWGNMDIEAWYPDGSSRHSVIAENHRTTPHYDWDVGRCPDFWEGSLDSFPTVKIRVRSSDCPDIYGESAGTIRITGLGAHAATFV